MVRNLVKVRYDPQIKGRNFEVPGCGGFMMTGYADDLDSYYSPGKEIVCFRDNKDLLDIIKYYLANEDERKAVAFRGLRANDAASIHMSIALTRYSSVWGCRPWRRIPSSAERVNARGLSKR